MRPVRSCCVAGVHNLMAMRSRSLSVTAGILQLELKATKAADALDGGVRTWQPGRHWREQETASLGERSATMSAAEWPLPPLIGGFGADEHEALVGGAPGKAKPIIAKEPMISDWKP